MHLNVKNTSFPSKRYSLPLLTGRILDSQTALLDAQSRRQIFSSVTFFGGYMQLSSKGETSRPVQQAVKKTDKVVTKVEMSINSCEKLSNSLLAPPNCSRMKVIYINRTILNLLVYLLDNFLLLAGFDMLQAINANGCSI